MNEKGIINPPNGAPLNDINAFRAMVLIPAGITVCCTFFDFLSKCKIKQINILDPYLICEVVVSYFLPSLVSVVLCMLWTHYFGDTVSGIKEGHGSAVLILTICLGLMYGVYLFLIDTWFVFVFVFAIFAYIYVVIKYYIDNEVLKGAGLQGKPQVK